MDMKTKIKDVSINNEGWIDFTHADGTIEHFEFGSNVSVYAPIELRMCLVIRDLLLRVEALEKDKEH